MVSIFTPSPSTGPKRTLWEKLTSKLNFYRTHLLFFTFTPLIVSGIFYASNGRYRVSYTDSLFNCVSAMTVCGLATVNLSGLTPFQQVLLFILMTLGNPVLVSWVIVYIRRYFFAQKFEDILKASLERRVAKDVEQAVEQHKPWPRRFLAYISGKGLDVVPQPNTQRKAQGSSGGVLNKVRPDMIRRMDEAPKLVNPSGWVSEGHTPSIRKVSISLHRSSKVPPNMMEADDPDYGGSSSNPPKFPEQEIDSSNSEDTRKNRRRLSDPGVHSGSTSPESFPTQIQRSRTIAESQPQVAPKHFPRTQTIEFAPDPVRRRDKVAQEGILEGGLEDNIRRHEYSTFHHNTGIPPEMHHGHPLYSAPSIPMSTRTQRTHHTHHSIHPVDAMTQNFGGFPSPFAIVKSVFGRLFPGVRRQLTRAVTIPATVSLTPGREGLEQGKKYAPYISFDAVVGRNSKFHFLTQDQLEEIGGVEYRALNALLWIVALYHIGVQTIAFVVIAPYISTSKWSSVFQQQIRPVNTVWFSLFQVVSAYTNTGMSLVDESMVPFQKAYPMIVALMMLILAGNTSFPIFLRFMIWLLSKVTHEKSRLHETLHFLLDHPRRCFIYLFPSHQTWFLLSVVLLLTFIDWFFFMILDLKTPVIEEIPVGVRLLDGLFQGIAVRAAGFSIVPLAALAPAVQVLYVVMMYISAYPIAMSVRSTNVYEEQSLGVFDPQEHDGAVDEADPERTTTWSRYLSMHARQQLAFDMWWLALSLFIICIIEKNNLENVQDYGWFTIFRVIFELVSAYGTVGLSLGIPDENYSFVGAMHPLSKLVICVVMLRGRHRALPVAIDRAIMFPHEFKKDNDNTDDTDAANLNDDDPNNSQRFVYSETMNSQRTGELRQRGSGKSIRMSTINQGHDSQRDNNDDPRTQPDGDSLEGDREP